MIKTLRKRFIRIAMLAVTAVLLALCLIVNAANYISVDNSLTNMLQIISNNRGMVPQSPPGGFDKPGTRPEGGFTPETPFSTRYFVLVSAGRGKARRRLLLGQWLSLLCHTKRRRRFYGHFPGCTS